MLSAIGRGLQLCRAFGAGDDFPRTFLSVSARIVRLDELPALSVLSPAGVHFETERIVDGAGGDDYFVG